MLQPANHHSHPPPPSSPDKAPDAGLLTAKCLPTPCICGHCDQRLPKAAGALASSRIPHRWFRAASSARAYSSGQALDSAPGGAPLRSDQRITLCMLCDTSGHAHGTVRLIFEPQRPFPYRQGQILQVLLPGNCGLEILITSHPGQARVMHGKLLAASGVPLPAQFGPDAAFGLMFQVCTSQNFQTS